MPPPWAQSRPPPWLRPKEPPRPARVPARQCRRIQHWQMQAARGLIRLGAGEAELQMLDELSATLRRRAILGEDTDR